MKNLTAIRYYLEIISVPIFAFIVIHLSGHGIMLLNDPAHVHHHEHEIHEEHNIENPEHDEHDEHLIENILSTENFAGFLALILFVWIWNFPPMKKFVPCSHDHCHHINIWSHSMASLAFLFHFFPESSIRYEMLKDFDWHSPLSLITGAGFFSHFLVDIIVMILLASFWQKTWQKVTAFVIFIAIWIIAFKVGENGGLHINGLSQGVIFVLSGFLIAMFVHKPHKPKACQSCTH